MTPHPETQETGTGVPLAIGHHDVQGPHPLMALGLAILVGVAVFLFIWRIRKTFGMKA